MPVEMIGIKTLYDICFSFPENYDDFMLELIEKSTKLLGASRIALISGEGEQRRCLVSRGFSGEREIYECINQTGSGKEKNCCFLYPFSNGTPGLLYLEKITPFTELDNLLCGMFSRRVEDIIDRKLKEKQLCRITDNMLDMISEIDEEGIYRYASPSFKNVLGYEPDDLRGQPFMDYVHSKDYARVEAALKKAVKNRTIKGLEYRYRNTAGDYLWLESTGNALLDKSGHFVGAVLGTRNITKRKQAEDKLKQSIKKLKGVVEGVIQAMSLTVEIRDPYTAGHQKRVAMLASAMAREMNIPEDKLEGIRLAAAIHDIGKIYVPAEFLSKPGEMSALELNMIQMHPQVGYEILKEIDFPWPIADIILQHHERMDRSGYPFGLGGDEILLEAKILAVADVVEAMASHRPYRPALGVGKALDEIKKNSGKLYDPRAVEACLKVFYEQGFSFD